MTRAQRKAQRDIRAILKPLDKDERLALIREVAFQLEIEAIATKLVRALADRRWKTKKRSID